ncbi:MAG: C1 family peptidase [bacterium]|nr:C1 family peptidase [bacterium]
MFRLVLLAALLPVLALAQQFAPGMAAFGPDDSIEVIRAKIRHNNYRFTVDNNWVYDMPPEMKADFLSRRMGISPRADGGGEEMGPLEAELGKTLPSSFDWRNRNGRSFIGDVKNQGSCGSCYAFGALAAAEGTYNYAMGLFDAACADFSESFVIWCLGRLSRYSSHFYGCSGADYDYYELEALTVEGVCTEAAFPYRQTDPGSCAHWDKERTVFASWHRIPCNDIDAIKTAIMTYGVVDAAVYAGSAFQAYSGGVYNDTNTSCSATPCYYATTNHAIALVGWDDSPPEGGGGVWILRNSWGGGWGEGGYMRLRYTAARVACAACYLVYEHEPAVVREAFDDAFPASGWQQANCDRTSTSRSGPYSVRFDNAADSLVTPLLRGAASLTYWMRASTGTSSFNVQYASSPAGPWDHLPGSPTMTNYANAFKEETFDLTGYGDIHVRFSRNDTKTYYLDDVLVAERPAPGARVNYQPNTATVPDGNAKDAAAPFGPRGSYSFGW